MTGQIIRVRNPQTLNIPEFEALVKEGFASLGERYDREAIGNLIPHPHMVIMVKPWTTLLAADLPPSGSVFHAEPYVTLFVNKGSRRDGRAVLDKFVDFLKELGYNKAWALNGSTYPDKVWARGLTPTGWKARHYRSLYEFGE